MNKDEIIIRKAQGTIDKRLSWRLGHLFLTNHQLYFLQMKKNLFRVPLDKITSIFISKRAWMLGCRIKQLCIVYQGQKSENCVYIAVADPEKWVRYIKKAIARRFIERWNNNGTKQEYPDDFS